ncbi:MAG: hypothetical protein MUO61_03440 [Dehalococcoidia bacterium]|nr:hypothetical protein [Dehalococcoidia bacterium]
MDNKEIVVNEPEQSESYFPAIIDTNIIAIAEQSEKRLEALNKIKKVALKLTNPHDWVDESGRPYLQASGAEKVARLFGISWRISEPIKEELEGGHFSYTYKGEFALGGASIEAIGTRSSKDGFFKKYKYAGDERLELPASEIDRGDVKKSAYTNLLGNGITRLLGIRNLTYDDLKEYANITQDQVTRVEFKKGGRAPAGKAPSSQPTKQTTPGPDEPATEAQGKAIHAQLGVLKVVDELAKMQKVAKILGLAKVPTAVMQITKAQASTVIQALQKEIDGGEQ